jgi:hypothetical protein
MRNFSTLTIIFLALSSRLSIGQLPGNQLFDNSKIHEIKIISLYESLAETLTTNYVLSFGIGQMQTRDIPYSQSLLMIDGTAIDTLGIRYKGFNSWWSSVKKPIKVDLNKYKKDQKYDGLSKFNLHNGAGDPSFIRENINYKILRSLGIKAPRTSYAKVYIDTAYMGLYRIVEQVDNTFLDVNFGNHKGNLYSQKSRGSAGFSLGWLGNSQEAYYESLELENHEKTNDWSDLIHFLDVLNNARDDDFRSAISSIFDVDEYLQILAFDVAVNNIDWYGDSGRNYYLAEVEGKFHWIPWDYNLTWRADSKPINLNPGDYPLLINRLLKVPEFHDTFLRKYCGLKSVFADSIVNLVTKEAAIIKPYLKDDPYMDYPFEAFETNIESSWDRIPGLKQFAAQRSIEISNTLESLNIDCSVVTEIPEVDGSALQLYPVPTNHSLNIGSFPGEEVRISIFNTIGQPVLKTNFSQAGTIDTSGLSSGYYVLKAIAGQKVYSKLFIVEH